MRRIVAVLALVLAAVNCPRSGSGTTESDLKPIEDWRDFLAQQATQACEWAVRCHGLSASMVDACIGAASSGFETDPTRSLESGALAYDAAKAAGCVDAIKKAGCGSRRPSIGDACRGVTRAARHAGETCYGYGDCIDSDCDLQGCSGTCIARSPIGGICGGEGNPRCGSDSAGCCESDASTTGVCMGFAPVGAECLEHDPCAYCDPSNSRCIGGRCTALAGEGQRCGPVECQPGLYCAPDKSDSVCRRVAPQGAACDSRTQGSGECGDLYCSPYSSRCEPRDRMPGETCGMFQGCIDSTCTYGSSGPPACTPFAKLGEECAAAATERNCEYALVCDRASGRCVEPGDEGDACASRLNCKMLLECEGGVCRQFPGRGEPCNYASDYFPKCRWPYVCDATNHCAEILSDGADCIWSFDCKSGRCVQGKCAPACEGSN